MPKCHLAGVLPGLPEEVSISMNRCEQLHAKDQEDSKQWRWSQETLPASRGNCSMNKHATSFLPSSPQWSPGPAQEDTGLLTLLVTGGSDQTIALYSSRPAYRLQSSAKTPTPTAAPPPSPGRAKVQRALASHRLLRRKGLVGVAAGRGLLHGNKQE